MLCVRTCLAALLLAALPACGGDERPPERPFHSVEEIETVRLTCDLCAPRLLDLRQEC